MAQDKYAFCEKCEDDGRLRLAGVQWFDGEGYKHYLCWWHAQPLIITDALARWEQLPVSLLETTLQHLQNLLAETSEPPKPEPGFCTECLKHYRKQVPAYVKYWDMNGVECLACYGHGQAVISLGHAGKSCIAAGSTEDGQVCRAEAAIAWQKWREDKAASTEVQRSLREGGP